VIPLPELYRICEIARRLLDGPDRVARVIARPFEGTAGSFTRTKNRKDFAIPPPEPSLLDALAAAGIPTIGIGKIGSIFDYHGIADNLKARDNTESMDQTLAALGSAGPGLVFSNFVDFDMLWGHRNDAPGYARGLEAFDRRLPELLGALRADDCLILSADHGCDPTDVSTDHTREYVPILVYGPELEGGVDLGTRGRLADIGQTIAENFGLRLPAGNSFLRELR